MRRSLALLRPEPGWSASRAAAEALALKVIGHPLFAAEAVPWSIPPAGADALLVGSAAVFRQGGPQLATLRRLPVHAVGEATAAAAQAAGFAVERCGTGGLQGLLDEPADRPCHYLRLGGEARVALVPQRGDRMTERIVYRMVPQSLQPELVSALLRGRPVVALHSGAAAAHFAAQVDGQRISRDRLHLLALAPRIAELAGAGWGGVQICETPSDSVLLAKAQSLCE